MTIRNRTTTYILGHIPSGMNCSVKQDLPVKDASCRGCILDGISMDDTGYMLVV